MMGFWNENEFSIVKRLSDEVGTVDETGFDYDRFIPGDYVERECIHENGEYSDHFPLFGGKFVPYSTFECFECGASIEIHPSHERVY